jgi:hypothetical protein
MKTEYEARAHSGNQEKWLWRLGGALVDGVEFAVRRSKQDGIAGD